MTNTSVKSYYYHCDFPKNIYKNIFFTFASDINLYETSKYE